MIKYILIWSIIYFSIGSFSIMENGLRSVIVFENESLIKLLKKADSLSNKSKYEGAIDVYNKALLITSEKKLSTDASYIYKKVGLIYYKQKEYIKALTYFKKSIKADSLSINAADSYFNLSLVHRKYKRKDSLFHNLEKSLFLYGLQTDTEQKFSTYLKAGILYKKESRYNQSLYYLLKAYKGFDSIGNLKKKASVCNSIGSVQRMLGNLDIAREYYTTALHLRKELQDTLAISFSYNNLANIFNQEKKYDSAIAYYTKSISLKKKLHHKKGIGKNLNNLATVYYAKKDFMNAMFMYKESLFAKKEGQDSLSIAYTYNELGILSLERNKPVYAKKYLDSAKATLSLIHNKDILLRNYEGYGFYYKLIGDYKKALNYKEKYITLYQSIFNEQQSKTIQELQEKFESALKEEKITRLSLSNLKKEKTITQQQYILNQKNWFLGAVFLLALLGFGMYLLLKQKQKTKKKDFELQKLEAVFKGQEIIKENIGKDLHDIITTSYDGIRLKILALAKTKNPSKVSNEIVQEISTINHQIRLISHRLSPLGAKLKETNLREIIISQLSEFQFYRKIFIDVQLPLPEELDTMNLDSQTNFYGILLEVLSNIEKHSQATKVIITHYLENANRIVFTISDNGIGFEKQQRQKGIGLVNIKQRALFLNGECIVESSDNGTSICIIFPINKHVK